MIDPRSQRRGQQRPLPKGSNRSCFRPGRDL